MFKVTLRVCRGRANNRISDSYSLGPELTDKPAASLDETEVCQLSKLCRKH